MKRVLSTVLCFILTGILLAGSEKFLMMHDSDIKMEVFYDRGNEYQVLFLGNSHMEMGITPMELWRDFKIRSYNLANFNQLLPTTYWQLVDALNYSKPDLVVIDVFGVQFDAKMTAQSHYFLDGLPFSSFKSEVVEDLTEGEAEYEEWLFPFSVYHNRWKEIDKSFFEYEPNVEKGACLDHHDRDESAHIKTLEKPEIISKDQICDKDTVAKEYLEKMIQLCKDRETDVLLLTVPFVSTEEQQEMINSVQVIADQWNVPFYDMNYNCDFLDFKMDFYDEGHLNSSGAKKTTNMVGEYISNNYEFEETESDEIAEDWKNDYEDYLSFKKEWLQAQENLEAYMMLLNDSDFIYDVEEEAKITVYDKSGNLIDEKIFSGQ